MIEKDKINKKRDIIFRLHYINLYFIDILGRFTWNIFETIPSHLFSLFVYLIIFIVFEHLYPLVTRTLSHYCYTKIMGNTLKEVVLWQIKKKLSTIHYNGNWCRQRRQKLYSNQLFIDIMSCEILIISKHILYVHTYEWWIVWISMISLDLSRVEYDKMS